VTAVSHNKSGFSFKVQEGKEENMAKEGRKEINKEANT
jgi:hypothetical protein